MIGWLNDNADGCVKIPKPKTLFFFFAKKLEEPETDGKAKETNIKEARATGGGHRSCLGTVRQNLCLAFKLN